ncbi:hypothetical protein IL992_15875 [Microbispora sp. NEAU-D428]|uniref:hypothetical protein n=1 Tax=Microbispora sitophila TaxID=2771537 RepID=UPI001868C3F2|nr:hypothetical protein [Microbispora sitophila]MBE3010663.1 hypothetical protein [Microbispora sitophila]
MTTTGNKTAPRPQKAKGATVLARGAKKSGASAETGQKEPAEPTNTKILSGDELCEWQNYKTMYLALYLLDAFEKNPVDEGTKIWDKHWQQLNETEAELVAWSAMLVAQQLLRRLGGDHQAVLREVGSGWLLPPELWKASKPAVAPVASNPASAAS